MTNTTDTAHRSKVFTYDALRVINEAAVKSQRNRNVHFDKLPITNDGTVYPTVFAMTHNDCEIRAKIILNANGDTMMLDMSFAEWDALPTAEAYKALAEKVEKFKESEREKDA